MGIGNDCRRDHLFGVYFGEPKTFISTTSFLLLVSIKANKIIIAIRDDGSVGDLCLSSVVRGTTSLGILLQYNFGVSGLGPDLQNRNLHCNQSRRWIIWTLKPQKLCFRCVTNKEDESAKSPLQPLTEEMCCYCESPSCSTRWLSAHAWSLCFESLTNDRAVQEEVPFPQVQSWTHDQFCC